MKYASSPLFFSGCGKLRAAVLNDRDTADENLALSIIACADLSTHFRMCSIREFLPNKLETTSFIMMMMVVVLLPSSFFLLFLLSLFFHRI